MRRKQSITICNFIKKMLSLKFEEGTLCVDHLNNFQRIMNQLSAMGNKGYFFSAPCLTRGKHLECCCLILLLMGVVNGLFFKN
jgi:hypothetical protein